ncbi:hypothetical protein QFZ54_003398 [Sphingomonas faeni]|nr:hypothetical protein [Sphingomonas faeni]
MFPREGGDLVWAPAFAGEQASQRITGNVIREPAQTFCVAFT